LIASLEVLIAASSQEITAECRFYLNREREYVCEVENLEVLDTTATVVFTGTHLRLRANEHVGVVIIKNSNTPFMIQEVFTTFPRADELEYNSAGLESINMTTPTHIKILYLRGNNIQHIKDNTFVNQPQLTMIIVGSSNVQEVGEDAFAGLSKLGVLYINDNHISEIQPKTFASLASVYFINLERNNLVQLGPLFTNNLMLHSLFLQGNQIDAISPSFVEPSTHERLRTVDLRGNKCSQQLFTLTDDGAWTDMDSSLNICYHNFVGSEDDQAKHRALWKTLKQVNANQKM
jgi:Leucine rich repeat